MIRRFLPLLTAILLAVVMAGCASPTPTPDPDGPVLLGFDAPPKSLATIVLSATPNAPQAQATKDSRRPTDTLPPPTFTPTPTPLVGIFMGASTFSAGSLLPTGTRPVAVVTLAPGPGTKIASGSGSTGSNPPSTNCGVPVAVQFANAYKNATVASR